MSSQPFWLRGSTIIMHMSVIFSQSFQFIRKHLMACFGILLFLVAAYLFGPKLLLGPQVLVETVIQKDFSQSIVASGHVESPHRVSLGSQITGTVLRIPVAEGEHVKSGASLIELESSELIANLKQATLTISLAKAKLRQLRELQKPQAEQAFKQAQINFETAQRATLRSQKLLSQGFLNQAAVDESQRAEQVAQAQMYSVEQQVSSLRTGGSDEVLAKENLAQAQAAREAALARLNYSHISRT
jgi:HlyD family secretion protein